MKAGREHFIDELVKTKSADQLRLVALQRGSYDARRSTKQQNAQSVYRSCLLVRIILWMLRMLSPIPSRLGRQSQYRRQPTGLAIPAFEMTLVTFGAAVVIGHLF